MLGGPKHFVITGRRKENLIAPSQLQDFSYAPAVDDEHFQQLEWTPYALDLKKERVIEVGLRDGAVAKPQPFLYLDQYSQAEGLRLTPISLYASRIIPFRKNIRRIFIFSNGRAGSTLITEILRAAGLPTFSEPDALGDLSSARTVREAGLGEELASRLYLALIAHLEHPFTSPVATVYKFRAQHSNQHHLDQIKTLFPQAEFIFLFREVIPWARSMIVNFGFSNVTLKWLLSESLNAAEVALRSGAAVRVFSYSDLVAAPVRLTEALNLSIPKSVLFEVLKRDSQGGIFEDNRPATHRSSQKATERQIQDFYSWWKKNRQPGQLALLGLKGF